MSKAKVARKAPVQKIAMPSWSDMQAMFLKAIHMGQDAWSKLTPEQQTQIIAAVKKLFGFSTPRLAAFDPKMAKDAKVREAKAAKK